MRDAGFQPVFIMGPHRSGTTIFYQLLAAAGPFNVTTIYHVLYREELLQRHRAGREQEAWSTLAQLFAARGLSDREFDSVKIAPDMPEEYGYALEYQGARPRLSPRNLPGFLRFCDALQQIQTAGRPLLLKNPFDADNFVYMRRVLPGARFVYIHRDPVEVVNSQVRAVRSCLAQRNEYMALVVARYRRLYEHSFRLALARTVYGERWPWLLRRVIGTVTRANDYFVRHVEELADSYCGVTYSQLCRDPAGTIERVLAFLNLRASGAPDYARLIQPRESKLLPEVARAAARIRERNAAYCRRCGL